MNPFDLDQSLVGDTLFAMGVQRGCEAIALDGMPEETSVTEPKRRSLAWMVAPNLWASFRYAWQGITYATRTQRNFRIHLGIGVVAIALSFSLHVIPVEMAMICAMIALVLVLELLNTAIESVVDLSIAQSYHELAKIAKDCAAGAVLVAAIASVVVAGLILIPHLLEQWF